MRAICQVCKDKDSCTYLKNNKTSDCIDVQTSDYGYEEAIEKACEWFSEHIIEYVYYDEMDGWNINHKEIHKDFRKAMEE